MGYLYSEESCSPDCVRFTKEKISPRFSAPHNEETIFDLLEKIQGGSLEPSAFPTIRVVKFGGQLWSLDNRRLWLFQKAGVASIMVREMPMEKSKAFKKFLQKTPLAHVQMMAAKEFVPQVDYAWDGLVDIIVKVKKWLRADDIKSEGEEEDEEEDEVEEEEEEEEEEEGNNDWERSPARSGEDGRREKEKTPDSDDTDLGENQYPVLWKSLEEEEEDGEEEIHPVYK